MKKLLTICALSVFALSTHANAAERLHVYEVHNFVEQLNSAVNNVNLTSGYNTLDSMIANSAFFEDNINTHYAQPYHVNNAYYYNQYGYRYPYLNPYTNVGFKSLDKWEQINKLQMKKKTVAGYKGTFEMQNFKLTTLADSAVVDLDFKETSLSYAPGYAPYYYNHVNLNTHSKCKMHLGKVNGKVHMTRMYCNTSTNLPI